MNYSRRKNDSQIHTLLEDMKKMNAVVTRLQREITDLSSEVQELRQSASRSYHRPGEEEGPRHTSPHQGLESSRSRESGKLEKHRELLQERGNEPTTHSSNPWDDRISTRHHHSVDHF
jgi:predicted RNase H-like nuclease (RuvC/YqgF family)